MRHHRAGRKLGRDSAHRKALYSNLAGALIEHGRIKTTDDEGEGGPADRRADDHARPARRPPRAAAGAGVPPLAGGRAQAVRRGRAALQGPARAATRGSSSSARVRATPPRWRTSSSSTSRRRSRPRRRRSAAVSGCAAARSRRSAPRQSRSRQKPRPPPPPSAALACKGSDPFGVRTLRLVRVHVHPERRERVAEGTLPGDARPGLADHLHALAFQPGESRAQTTASARRTSSRRSRRCGRRSGGRRP